MTDPACDQCCECTSCITKAKAQAAVLDKVRAAAGILLTNEERGTCRARAVERLMAQLADNDKVINFMAGWLSDLDSDEGLSAEHYIRHANNVVKAFPAPDKRGDETKP